VSLLALDACFSGGFARDVVSRPGVMGLFSSEEDLTSAVADKFEAGGYLSHFLRAGLAGEGDGDTLSEVELLQNCIFILNAGHETTTNLIGNALVLLCHWPGERARLLSEPALVRTAIEEVLRFESPNQLGNRMTTRAVEIGGIPLAAGTSITLGIGAANRDPERFTRPDVFDVSRQPNRLTTTRHPPHGTNRRRRAEKGRGPLGAPAPRIASLNDDHNGLLTRIGRQQSK
jgi:cytochrome P450